MCCQFGSLSLLSLNLSFCFLGYRLESSVNLLGKICESLAKTFETSVELDSNLCEISIPIKPCEIIFSTCETLIKS
jgi:hypothetical protein